MATYRANHKKNYTLSDNSIWNIPKMCLIAIGIYQYALYRPDSWQFSVQDLLNRFTQGREAINKALKILEQHGYLVRVQTREKGRYINTVWSWYETPELRAQAVNLENNEQENPSRNGKPHTGNRIRETVDGNPLQSNTVKANTEKTNNIIINIGDDDVSEDKNLRRVLNVISSESIPLEPTFIVEKYQTYGYQLVVDTLDEMCPEDCPVDRRPSIFNPPGLFTSIIKRRSNYNKTMKARAPVPAPAQVAMTGGR